jgi:hypothetical protein
MVIRYVYGSGKEAFGGDKCARCGATPVGRILCFIECEKPIRKGELSWFSWVFLGLLAPAYALLYTAIKREPKVVSEGKALEFYIALCPSCQKPALSPQCLRELLRREEVFARLLDKYPEAVIGMSAPPGS